MVKISVETKEDGEEVELLLDTVFSPGRKMLSSYRLRESVSKVNNLSVIARDSFLVLIGVVRCWPVLIGKNNDSCLLIGPVAIHPAFQGEGIGSLLLNHIIKNSKLDGWQRAILVGDISYYSRFGFFVDQKGVLEFPNPVDYSRLLQLELVSGSFCQITGKIKPYWK